ncbi:TraB/GumN family protein [Desulfitibacter alkalitolerans]|uniref:TraB/GumN family protein n=1 Tax=Desulfitibacter alkalitolerans TaxID=264641 RepID=UPI00048904BF|nr:TraB/GumN family protein [Desulfitibacter alkalitolerans]
MTSSNVTRLEMDGREIILIGTAHVSKKSADEVEEIIQQEQPDTVCVELCQARYQGITDADRWKNTDIVKIIKEGKALILLINLILSSYQKRLARQFGIQPGQEMIQGIKSAQEIGATLCLADRDLHTTMRRLWRRLGFIGKMKLFFQLMMSMFVNEEISEEELEKMKSQDMLTSALDELSKSFPEFKSIVIDERDKYLAQKIKDAPGSKIVAVLGAGHVPGIKDELFKDNDLEDLSKVPPPSKVMKVIAWSIPVIIIAIIASTFSVDRSAGVDQMISWILWNGSLGALGTLLAFGHPFSILTAFVVAPISSLSPLLAAGWFAGLTEALVRKPSVKDFESLSEDVHSIKGFWRNKVTHILLVVVFANLGSTLGTVIGGADVIRHFINTFFG